MAYAVAIRQGWNQPNNVDSSLDERGNGGNEGFKIDCGTRTISLLTHTLSVSISSRLEF